MTLTKEEADKIKVTEDTEVAYINGETIYAENLKCYLYRRLETWPDLLTACKALIEGWMGKPESRRSLYELKQDMDKACELANKAITEAEKDPTITP